MRTRPAAVAGGPSASTRATEDLPLSRRKPKQTAEAADGPGGVDLLGPALFLLAGFVVAGLLVYGPALDGPFISDDQHYVVNNPYLQELSFENLRAIVDPTSPLVGLVENYAPVHLLAHALERSFFGLEVRGYHVVNVGLHALASALLVLLFVRTGLGWWAGALGGALFLLHPANVEAVAWISQLKSSAALVLACAALLAHPRRPALGALLFALALLAKPMAFFALPFAAAWGWIQSERARRSGHSAQAGSGRVRWGWLVGWAVILAGFSTLEVSAFAETAGTAPVVYADPAVRLRSSVAIFGRYLLMAASGHGLSTFHETPPVTSWADPWWIGSLVAAGLLGWRMISALRGRRPEFAWWVWAAAAYAPFSGVIALPHTMADRYLYHALPGLIAACLFAAGDGLAALDRRWRWRGLDPRHAAVVAGLGVAGLCVFFAAQAHDRARLWRSEALVMAESARNYPDGRAALLNRARRAARTGDASGAALALGDLQRRGFNRLDVLLKDPVYAPLRGDPAFDAVLADMAAYWIAVIKDKPDPSQLDLHLLGVSYHLRAETSAAVDALQRALALEGPESDQIRRNLEEVRRVERLGGS